MVHNFTKPSGEGRISQNIKELQEAVKKITPKGSSTVSVNVTSNGATFSTKKTVAESVAAPNVVCRWL